MGIGERLKFIRDKKALNQGDFANFLGISQQNLSNYENNKRDIPESIKIKLQHNGVNLNWLLTGNGEPFLTDKKKEVEKSIIEKEIEKMIEEKTAEKLKVHEERISKVVQKVEKVKEETKEDLNKIYKELYELYYSDHKEKKAPKVTVRTMGSDGTVYESAEDRDEDNNTINRRHIKSSKPLYPGIVPVDDVFGLHDPAVLYGATIEVPLIESLAAGIPAEASHNYDTYPVPHPLIKTDAQDYCVARISGTSMTDVDIPDGSFVLLEYCSEAQNGAISVVQYESETTLKLLHQKDDGQWELLYCDGSRAKIELEDGDWQVKARYITTLKKNR